MTLEEKLHKELDWLEIKHIDADKIIKKVLSICQEAVDEAKPKWISVKDRLPEKFKNVIACEQRGTRAITCITVDGSWDYYPFTEDINFVTHWMPLPKSPELKEKL